jgi:hypothetical protein
VLCDGVDPAGWEKPNYEFYPYSGMCGEPTAYIMKVTGLSHKAVSELVRLNDTNGANFPEIADWIEKNL